MELHGFDGLPPVSTQECIQCSYTNSSPHLQILRIENVESWYFERVIFPGQNLGFCATTQAIARIYSCDHAGCLLDDNLRCVDLQISDGRPSRVVPVAPKIA
ncbi:DUF1830 domain-containing protein [Candidatus Cyanaurora vandensis]|uniref:DUF1830 domain-containing protein n=1 Tax=Candidatus Cyanaurora vandensis TaxID=2714958 RepID=UPI00257E8ED0|nr:DUF1830 domain-containing protein [Candidatus Cyanaurora vandensis]